MIIEIGTRFGGGALYIADLLENIGKGVLHADDIVDNVNPEVKKHERIKFFFNGWKDYDLSLTEGYETILVIEDASHMYEDSIGALNKFHKVVSKDSYFIVEDGVVNKLGMEERFEGGPLKEIREFLPENPTILWIENGVICSEKMQRST